MKLKTTDIVLLRTGMAPNKRTPSIMKNSSGLSLTPRESSMLPLLHLSNKEISGMLKLSTYTVQKYIQEICQYFGVSNRAQALVAALKRNIVSIEDLA